MKDVAPYKDMSIGSELRINGPQAASHVDACVKKAVSLFNFVDGWSPNAEATE